MKPSLLGNPAVAYNEESFTIPAGSVAKGSTVTVEAQYPGCHHRERAQHSGHCRHHRRGRCRHGGHRVAGLPHRHGAVREVFPAHAGRNCGRAAARKLRQLPLPERRRTRSLPRLTKLHKNSAAPSFPVGRRIFAVQSRRKDRVRDIFW